MSKQRKLLGITADRQQAFTPKATTPTVAMAKKTVKI
jgi:hypothetical protein